MPLAIINHDTAMVPIRYLFLVVMIALFTEFMGVRLYDYDFEGLAVGNVIASFITVPLVAFVFLVDKSILKHWITKFCILMFVFVSIVNYYRELTQGRYGLINVLKDEIIIIPGVFFSIVLYHFYRSRSDANLIIKIIFWIGLLYILLQVYCWITGSYAEIFNDKDLHRYGGMRQRFLGRNTGTFIDFAFIYSIINISNSKQRFVRLSCVLFIVLLLFYSVFIYKTKGFLISLALMYVISMYLIGKKGKVLFVQSLLLACAIGAVSYWYYSDELKEMYISYRDDFINDESDSARIRREGVEEYSKLFLKSYGLGIGEPHGDRNPEVEYLSELHYQIVDIGIVGVFFEYGLFYIILMVILLRNVFFICKNREKVYAEGMQMCLIVPVTVFIVHFITFTPAIMFPYRAYSTGLIMYYFACMTDLIKVSSNALLTNNSQL